MRFLIDMNLSPDWIVTIKNAVFDAVHWSEIGKANASDRSLMEWAADHDHVVVTADLDFSAILAAMQINKPSVVQIRGPRQAPEVIGPLVVRALLQTQTELAEGAVVSVEPTRTRVRVLPLAP